MTKIQSVKRKDETTVYTIYIPVQAIEDSGLQKGDEVEVTATSIGTIQVKRK